MSIIHRIMSQSGWLCIPPKSSALIYDKQFICSHLALLPSWTELLDYNEGHHLHRSSLIHPGQSVNLTHTPIIPCQWSATDTVCGVWEWVDTGRWMNRKWEMCLPNSGVHRYSSWVSKIFRDECDPVTSIKVHHINPVDTGLHHIKFIIHPIHRQVLRVVNRYIQNHLHVGTVHIHRKHLYTKDTIDDRKLAFRWSLLHEIHSWNIRTQWMGSHHRCRLFSSLKTFCHISMKPINWFFEALVLAVDWKHWHCAADSGGTAFSSPAPFETWSRKAEFSTDLFKGKLKMWK